VIFSTLYLDGMIAPINSIPTTRARKSKTKVIGESREIMSVF